MTADRGRRALVLAAHGAGDGSAANALVRRLATEAAARGGFDEAAAAFHRGTPGFSDALAGLAAGSVTVVPLLTSAGYYHDLLRRALRRSSRRNVAWRVTRPVGTHPGLAAVVARRVAGLLAQHGLEPDRTATLVVGHGTRRHPHSRRATLALANALARGTAPGARGIRARLVADVAVGFLDDDPGVAEALAEIEAPNVVVVPFLIGGGKHVIKDLEAAVAEARGTEHGARDGDGSPVTAHRSPVVDIPIGDYPEMLGLILDFARTPPRAPRAAPRATEAPRPGPRARTRRFAAPTPGTVHLVGAGPGDPDLITVRGLRLLERADVVVHDRLVPPQLLHRVRPEALIIDAGKAPGGRGCSQEWINHLLVAHAREGRRVVRLKGGDPFVFGRGGEELAFCRAAGVRCEIVPGVTSALAVPAAAGIPVTHRGVVRSLAVITGQAEPGSPPLPDPAALAAMDTVVILMGRSTLRSIAADLVAAGRPADTPVACIENGTTADQRVVTGTLHSIAVAVDRAGLEAPVVTVVGAMAGWAGAFTHGARGTERRASRAEHGARSTGLPDRAIHVV